MVQISKFAAALATASFLSSVIAHPGESHDHARVRRDIRKRDVLAATAKRSLEACSNTLKARQLDDRAITRRSAKLADLRVKRGITLMLQTFLAGTWLLLRSLKLTPTT